MDASKDETNMQLIKLVSQHPLLYDFYDANYKNQPLKDEIWWEIAAQMNNTSEGCRRQWKHIRDGYARFKRKNNISGSEAQKHGRCKWKIYRMLTFLDSIIPEVPVVACKVESDPLDEEETMPENDDTESTHHMEALQFDYDSEYLSLDKNQRKISKRRRVNKIDEETGNTNLQIESSLKTEVAKNSDEELGSFSNLIRDVLKKLPPVLQIKAKQEMYQIIAKYEMLAVEDALPCSCRASDKLERLLKKK